METLDRQLQRRVWARVYGKKQEMLSSRQRDNLRRCLARSRENLAVYESMEHHRIYAEAFQRLAQETKEHIKMLQKILGQ